MLRICINCRLEKEHHAKGLCYTCYKKTNWQPKLSYCKRCKKERQIHAKELCGSCYTSAFHLDKNRAYYHRKKSGLDIKTFRRTTEACLICGFNRIVDLHYLDKNKENQSKENLVGLCPNHGRELNNQKYRQEVLTLINKAKNNSKTEEKPLFRRFLPSFSE